MDSTRDSMTQTGSHSTSRRPSGESSVQTVFGFPVDQNQFNVLRSNQSAESQRSTQREKGLVDPRTTRHLRQATVRASNREEIETGEHSLAVHVENPAQEIFDSDTCVESVAVGNTSQFFQNSFPASSSDILL